MPVKNSQISPSTIVRLFKALASQQSWSRLSEQFFRFDKWSLCRG